MMMNFDCFKWGFVIFCIGNEYQDVYADLYKLKSDFNGSLCEEKTANMWLLSCQHTWNRGHFGIKLVLFRTSKIHDFWCSDILMCYLSIGFGITQFRVVWTKLWPIYSRLCRMYRNWELNWNSNFTEKLVLIGSLKNCIFGVWIDQWVIFQMPFESS